MSLTVAAFDIGKKNFAFVVEIIPRDELLTLRSKNLKRENLINEILPLGKILVCENIDLTQKCKDVYLDYQTFVNMTDVLDKFTASWDMCDVFLIEQQMNFGKKRNPMALKLGQHCFSYFSIKYRLAKRIIEFPSYHKTQILNAPKKFGMITKTFKNGKTRQIKDNHKKWSIRIAHSIIKLREDNVMLQKFEALRKKDDVSDCLLMIKAFQILEL